jgi:methyl-accepting chemotaxis protein
MNISHLKIGTRLGLAFGLLIVMMLGIALIGVLRLGKVGEINTRLIEDDWVRAEAASVIDTTTRSNARRTMELVIASDAEHQKLVKAAIGTNKKTIDDAIAVLDQRVYLPEAKAVLLRLKELRGKIRAVVQQGRANGGSRRPRRPALFGPRRCLRWMRCRSRSMR